VDRGGVKGGRRARRGGRRHPAGWSNRQVTAVAGMAAYFKGNQHRCNVFIFGRSGPVRVPGKLFPAREIYFPGINIPTFKDLQTQIQGLSRAMSVFKDFPGFKNLEKKFKDFQGPARALQSQLLVYLHKWSASCWSVNLYSLLCTRAYIVDKNSYRLS